MGISSLKDNCNSKFDENIDQRKCRGKKKRKKERKRKMK